MSDLIRRQDAIDALKKIMFTHLFECGEYIGEDTREVSIMNAEKALDVIKNLPSAEPERKWIPVTEALPEECVSVLIQMNDGEMAVSQRRGMNYWDGYRRRGDIIAWKPLPEPWRGE